MMKSGDRVTLEYETKTYHGVVDPQDDVQPASSKPGILEKELLESKDGPPVQMKCDPRIDTSPPSSKRTPPWEVAPQETPREEDPDCSPGVCSVGRRTSPRKLCKRKFHDRVSPPAKKEAHP